MEATKIAHVWSLTYFSHTKKSTNKNQNRSRSSRVHLHRNKSCNFQVYYHDDRV